MKILLTGGAGEIAACYAKMQLAKAKFNWVATRGLDEIFLYLWKWQQYCQSLKL